MVTLKYTPSRSAELIRDTRKELGVTQKDLALTSGTGLRFIIELEKGKETCEIGKALTILQTLGIKITLTPPAAAKARIRSHGQNARCLLCMNDLVGHLVQDDGGQMVFEYAESWLNKPGATPLSQSLPLRNEAFLAQ